MVRGEAGKRSIVAIGQPFRGPSGPRSYIIVDGFTLRHVDPWALGSTRPLLVHVNGSSSYYNVIRNCTIQAQGKAVWSGGIEDAFLIFGAKHTTIESNHISGLPRLGIVVGGIAQYTTIRGNTILNCHRSSIDIGSSEGTMQYTLIEDNLLDGSLLEDGIQFEHNYDLPAGTIDTDSNRGTVIRNNIIRNHAENGVDLKGAAYIIIEGNIFYGAPNNDDGGLNPNYGDNRSPGAATIMHGSGTSSHNVIIRRNVLYDGPGGILPENYYKIYNNTIIYNNRDYTGPNSSWGGGTNKPTFTGIAAWNGRTGIAIKNNIVGGHNAADIAIRRSSPALEIDYNLYFNDNDVLLVDYRDLYSWSLVPFSQWPSFLASQSVQGADYHSRQAAPLFVNVPADPTGPHTRFDFHLQTGSPAVDRGGFLTTTTSAGQGTSILVKDAGYFFDGYGIVEGDTIQLQGQTVTARIVSINSNTLVVNKSLSWSSGQGVSLAYQGSAPDAGAYEYGGSSTTYALTISSTNGSIARTPDKSSYISGETVILQATPNAGYTFSGWSGALTGTTNPATLVMDSNKTVTANFAAAGSGAKMVGNATVFTELNRDANRRAAPYTMPEAGQLQSISLYHEAGNGQMILGVYADSAGRPGTCLGVTHSTTVSGSAGWQTVPLSSPVPVSSGQQIWLAWVFEINPGVRAAAGTPGRANSSDTWSGGMPSTFGASTVADYIYSICATYTSASGVSYTLAVSASNGSVTQTPNKTSYTAGETVTLQATPSAGYTFSGWSGALTGTANPATLVMDSNKSVTANFTAVTYTLGVSAANGTVTQTPNKTSYTYGETVTLQATPNAGYTFSGWSGALTGTTNPATLLMDSSKSVAAHFVAETYTLSVSATNGVVTKTPDQTRYSHGEVVTLQAVPDANYVFVGWSGDASGTDNPTAITMDSPKTVVASFVRESNDRVPPALGNCSPAPDSIQAPPNTLVVLHLTDEGEGVDAASVSIHVNGDLVYTGDADSHRTEYGACHRSGTKADYTYTYQPYGVLGYSREIFVTVNARDLAGNTMPEQRYAFASEMYSFGVNFNVTVDQTGLDQGKPATVGDGQDNLWIVWQAGNPGSRHIYAARFLPDVDTYGSTVQVSQGAGDHCQPAAAIDSRGTLYAVWQENASGRWDVCVSTSTDGIVWSSPRPIVDATKSPADAAVNRIYPALAAGRSSSGLVAVAWQEDQAGNQDICLAHSTDGFQTVTVSRVTSDAADQTDPTVAIDSQDTIFLLWTDARKGATDIYGAASDEGPWTNVPVTDAPSNQSQAAVAVGSVGRTLHLVWVDDATADLDVFYATSEGLPTAPLAGTRIIDDTSGADQQTPVLGVAAGADGTDRVFVCWEDGRNIAYSGDTDLYFADVGSGSLRTNVLIDDDGTGVNQYDVALGVDGSGYPYVVWTDDVSGSLQLYYSGTTYASPVPLAETEILASEGGVVGTPPSKIKSLDDVSVVIPAQACPFAARISIARICNPQGFATEALRHYEFGPSGLSFAQPVTITIPYEARGTNAVKAYWFDSVTSAFRDEGVTEVQDINVGRGLRALQFKTTHFTPFYLVLVKGPDVTDGGKLRRGTVRHESDRRMLLERFRELRARLYHDSRGISQPQ